MEHLVHECSIALGHALGKSMKGSYFSHLNSYLNFCKLHNLSMEPTEDTLSFYVVYMSAHIEPCSVDSYLSGIASELKTFFPAVWKLRSSQLVQRTLRGCMRLQSNPIQQKRVLDPDDLQAVANAMVNSPQHDDLLSLAQLLTGFHGLMRLGELVWPDTMNLRDFRKLSLRHLTLCDKDEFSFLLPAHKSDPFFDGSQILITCVEVGPDPVDAFSTYLRSCNTIFPLRPKLWLRANGCVPI